MLRTHPIKLAIIGGGEEIKQLCQWPPSGDEVCANILLTLFDQTACVPPGSDRRPLEQLDATAFDLVVDLRENPEFEPSLAQLDPQQLVSGPGARLINDLLGQLQKACQDWQIQRGIIDSATDAIITINEDHIIVGYNQGAEKIFGYTRAEALGRDLEIVIPPPYKREHKDYVRRFLATRRPHVIGKHTRLKAQRKNGEEFPMSISFSVAEIGDNLYFTGIIRDITDSVNLEVRLRQSERLAAVGNTIGHIVHEIKNPLTIIGGFAKQLSRAPSLDEKGRQKLNIIAEEVERLESLVAEMKDFSHPPTLRLERGRIESVIDEVLTFYVDLLQDQGVSLYRQQPESLPTVSFDRQQMKQVLFNLMKNAAEAMPQGGQLTLAVRVKEPYLEIEVSDTGKGMTPEVAQNIFTPYFTTKDKGSGLGLAICKNILKAHGGDIVATTTPGRGSTFTILLPLEETSTSQ